MTEPLWLAHHAGTGTPVHPQTHGGRLGSASTNSTPHLQALRLPQPPLRLLVPPLCALQLLQCGVPLSCHGAEVPLKLPKDLQAGRQAPHKRPISICLVRTEVQGGGLM